MAEKRYTLIFYGAVLVAGAATFGVYRVLQATKESSRVATQPVVVASQDIPEGLTIDRPMLAVVQWPVGTAPAGAYATVDSVATRVTRLPVFKGEALVPGRLTPTGTGAGIEVKINPGKRAMSIPVSVVSGVSGLIQPNSRVDILVSIRDEAGQVDSKNRQVAKLFMENMRVLGVGQEIQRGPDGKSVQAATVTLEVTPDEAERLAVAVLQGQLSLVLRGYGDPDSVKTRGATSDDVLAQLRGAPRSEPIVASSLAAPRRRVAPAPRVVFVQPPRPPQPEVHRVTVYRAGKVTEEKFERDSTRETP
jgi:pilus assembly protein CpaB